MAFSINRRICATVFFLIETVMASVYANNKYERFFLSIDSAISQHEKYESILESQIKDLKAELDRVSDIRDIYLINKLLFSKYASYICDSALIYLDRNEEIAIRENKAEWIHDIYLDRCYIYIQTGMLSAAISEINEINVDELYNSNKARFYSLKVYLLSQESSFSGTPDTQKISEYGVELMKYATTDDESYIWGLLWSYQGDDKNEKLIGFLKKEYYKNISLNNIRAGNNALVLSRIYDQLNNEEESIKYLCLAALSDVKFVNRDPSALLDLVSFLSSIGDNNRAYIYLDYVLRGQSYYPARISGAQMAQYMKRIFDETLERNEQERRKNSLYLFWLSIVIVLLIILCLVISVFIHKTNIQKKNIIEINNRLNANLSVLSETKENLICSNEKMKKMSEQILETNKKLKESNYIKEEYIGYIFSACSNYLTKFDNFRQNINRKIKTGKIEEALQMTQSTNSFFNNEVKELNQTFDSTFLSIYPDFVEDFNSLLRKEERIIIHGNGELNTELRIFALVWLGVNSSSKIATLLHVSPQTVYNARMKMRNKANIIDGEKFSKVVCSLGREKLGF
ncbi:MAG: DUF6377 domain-containing protein [Tannerellaceae bacterium]|jgi:uncharacterized protein (UPF0297 family)|nr:DUF6377 domain-containing protein [Tannerellaceae bacterium]